MCPYQRGGRGPWCSPPGGSDWIGDDVMEAVTPYTHPEVHLFLPFNAKNFFGEGAQRYCLPKKNTPYKPTKRELMEMSRSTKWTVSNFLGGCCPEKRGSNAERRLDFLFGVFFLILLLGPYPGTKKPISRWSGRRVCRLGISAKPQTMAT